MFGKLISMLSAAEKCLQNRREMCSRTDFPLSSFLGHKYQGFLKTALSVGECSVRLMRTVNPWNLVQEEQGVCVCV